MKCLYFVLDDSYAKVKLWFYICNEIQSERVHLPMPLTYHAAEGHAVDAFTEVKPLSAMRRCPTGPFPVCAT